MPDHDHRTARPPVRKVANEPIDGQTALDFSFQMSNNSPRRIGVDVKNSEFVVMQPTYGGREALLEAIAVNDVDTLGPMIIAAALYEDDFDTAYRACVQLSSHVDEVVRGNAILGLGHLARLFGQLGDEAPGIVKLGLVDPSSYVRGQAHAAAGDLQHFLGIEVRDPDL